MTPLILIVMGADQPRRQPIRSLSRNRDTSQAETHSPAHVARPLFGRCDLADYEPALGRGRAHSAITSDGYRITVSNPARKDLCRFTTATGSRSFRPRVQPRKQSTCGIRKCFRPFAVSSVAHEGNHERRKVGNVRNSIGEIQHVER